MEPQAAPSRGPSHDVIEVVAAGESPSLLPRRRSKALRDDDVAVAAAVAAVVVAAAEQPRAASRSRSKGAAASSGVTRPPRSAAAVATATSLVRWSSLRDQTALSRAQASGSSGAAGARKLAAERRGSLEPRLSWTRLARAGSQRGSADSLGHPAVGRPGPGPPHADSDESVTRASGVSQETALAKTHATDSSTPEPLERKGSARRDRHGAEEADGSLGCVPLEGTRAQPPVDRPPVEDHAEVGPPAGVDSPQPQRRSKAPSRLRAMLGSRLEPTADMLEQQLIAAAVAQDVHVKHVDFDAEYDIVHKIGEGWFSRVYLVEHRESRQEVVVKAINSKNVAAEDFVREFYHARLLSAHDNILTAFDECFLSDGHYMFASEYAPFGDLTSNMSADRGLGEMCTKRVARQVGAALQWIHSKGLCHLDVKMDNILVFRSDFSWVKVCDFGSVRQQGDIMVKKNELLPYCPPELAAKQANDYYQVDRAQDVFQFGIVIFFCLFASLPWQRADTSDPNYAEFFAWRSKRTSKPPKSFKTMTSRAQKLFRKLMDVEPGKRLPLGEVTKFTDDRWLKKLSGGSVSGGGGGFGVGGVGGAVTGLTGLMGGKSPTVPTSNEAKWLSDGISQLTMGSFQSVHSNAIEKNRILFTLMQHGVETTVDRSQKTSRILDWIENGQATRTTFDESPNAVANDETVVL